MKKIMKIILFNTVIILLLVFLTDFIVYKYYALTSTKNNPAPEYQIDPVHDNSIFYETIKYFFEDEENKDIAEDDRNSKGRKPSGLEYKDKPAVIVFGCSFAFGHYLKNNQTFSYKLSEIIKRPVYNRAIPGKGLQQMYMQTLSDWFYQEVPYADTVIYIMIDDHYRRLKIHNFSILESGGSPIFKVKNGKLVLLKRDNKLYNYLINLYISKHFNHVMTNKYINNPNNAQELTDEVLLYFLESRKELQKHFCKDIKFYVVFYKDVMYSDILRKKLEDNGFKTVSTDELTDKDLETPEYMRDDGHPGAAAWDLLTPLIVEKFELK